MPEKIRDEVHLPVRHKTFRNSNSKKKCQKIKQNKTFRFFSFSQISSFAEKISNEKDFHSTRA